MLEKHIQSKTEKARALPFIMEIVELPTRKKSQRISRIGKILKMHEYLVEGRNKAHSIQGQRLTTLRSELGTDVLLVLLVLFPNAGSGQVINPRKETF